MDIVNNISTKLYKLKNIKSLNNTEGKLMLESGKDDIKKLLNDNNIDIITSKEIPLVIKQIKDQIYSDMTEYKKFTENGGELYIELLDEMVNYINKNIIEIFEEKGGGGVTKVPKVSDEKINQKIKTSSEISKAYFNNIGQYFGIFDITEDSYAENIPNIGLQSMTKERLQESLNLFKSYSDILQYTRHKNINKLIIKQLKERITRIGNKEKETLKRQNKLKNINSIKKTIPRIIENIEEFKINILSYDGDNKVNNDSVKKPTGQLKMFLNENIEDFAHFSTFLKTHTEILIDKNKKFLDDIKLKGDEGNNEKNKFAHELEKGVFVYTKLDPNQIKIGLERDFFWGEIDELINYLDKLKNS